MGKVVSSLKHHGADDARDVENVKENGDEMMEFMDTQSKIIYLLTMNYINRQREICAKQHVKLAKILCAELIKSHSIELIKIFAIIKRNNKKKLVFLNKKVDELSYWSWIKCKHQKHCTPRAEWIDSDVPKVKEIVKKLINEDIESSKIEIKLKKINTAMITYCDHDKLLFLDVVINIIDDKKQLHLGRNVKTVQHRLYQTKINNSYYF